MIKVIQFEAANASLEKKDGNEFELRLEGLTKDDVYGIIDQLDSSVCGEPIEVDND